MEVDIDKNMEESGIKKNVNKNTYPVFLRYEILKRERPYKSGVVVLSRTSVCFSINKLTIKLSHSFHVPYITHSNVHFHTVVKQVLLIKLFIIIILNYS